MPVEEFLNVSDQDHCHSRVRSARVNAYLLLGRRPVIVDAGTPGSGRLIHDQVASHGVDPKDVRLIVVTHGHIDHFGSAAELSGSRAAGKASSRPGHTWGKNLPTEVIIPDVRDGDRVSIEGHDFELRGGHPDLDWRTEYLWQPEDRAVVGGVLLFAGLHAWIADTPTPRERAAWAEMLAEMDGGAPGSRPSAPRSHCRS
ncbi:MBL fold metallo-hydrolase [Streptomyces avermitilis]|uniref:MBL fold metallo-hydrolase n=1 Tax=Streptomyces avermitilis TaxID=33903 RepID=UPI0033BD7C08